MYNISLKCYINVSPARLIRIWRKPQILLREAKNIKNLKVIKREKDKIFSSWEVEVSKVGLRWRQFDSLDFKKGVIDFKMHDGEFKRYEGTWQILPTKDGKTLLKLSVDIDWGIPTAEPYVKKALERKSRLLFKSFLESIKKVVENYGR